MSWQTMSTEDCREHVAAEVWQTWFKRYGRARIEPVNSRDDVADYCAKYVTKEGSWWNVKLVGSRHPSMADFKLAGG